MRQNLHYRTFHIDPSGRLLVATHIRPLLVREGTQVRTAPACLSVFRIGDDEVTSRLKRAPSQRTYGDAGLAP